MRQPPSRISIHAPRTGSDDEADKADNKLYKFQSTLPARGATYFLYVFPPCVFNFNPRSPHGERRFDAGQDAPLDLFQSTLPARGATGAFRDVPRAAVISIHAPRTGSDWICRASSKSAHDFNPRSPHGERHRDAFKPSHVCSFQSTLPARGATGMYAADFYLVEISIHAPRTGSDGGFITDDDGTTTFQSTLPARGATTKMADVPLAIQISIHAPRTGSDTPRPVAAHSCTYFNPRSPHGERRAQLVRADGHLTISIHAPRTGSDAQRLHGRVAGDISIHAPRTGSDVVAGREYARREISIHAPRTGSDCAK